MSRTSISSRAARWSSQNRGKAFFGWIAFVVVAMALGSFVGTKNIADEDIGNGDSRTAEQLLADSGLPDDTTEQVIVQSESGQTVDDASFRAAIGDVEHRLADVKHVNQVSSPLDQSKCAVAWRSPKRPRRTVNSYGLSPRGAIQP